MVSKHGFSCFFLHFSHNEAANQIAHSQDTPSTANGMGLEAFCLTKKNLPESHRALHQFQHNVHRFLLFVQAGRFNRAAPVPRNGLPVGDELMVLTSSRGLVILIWVGHQVSCEVTSWFFVRVQDFDLVKQSQPVGVENLLQEEPPPRHCGFVSVARCLAPPEPKKQTNPTHVTCLPTGSPTCQRARNGLEVTRKKMSIRVHSLIFY